MSDPFHVINNEINKRYSGLAETTCCLSCGGALDFAEPQPGEICVDIGSGRGNDVIRMAEAAGEKGMAYGIDMADGMLERARRNAEKLGVKNAKFLRSTFECIELPDATADVVISNCAMNHATDKAKAWSEIFRIMKPGGRFVVSDIYAQTEVPAEYRNDPVAVAECWAGAVQRGEYLRTLEQCGFETIRVLEESKPYSKGKIEVSSFTLTAVKPGK